MPRLSSPRRRESLRVKIPGRRAANFQRRSRQIAPAARFLPAGTFYALARGLSRAAAAKNARFSCFPAASARARNRGGFCAANRSRDLGAGPRAPEPVPRPRYKERAARAFSAADVTARPRGPAFLPRPRRGPTRPDADRFFRFIKEIDSVIVQAARDAYRLERPNIQFRRYLELEGCKKRGPRGTLCGTRAESGRDRHLRLESGGGGTSSRKAAG